MRHLIIALLLTAASASTSAAQAAKPLDVTEASVTQLQQAMAEGRATSVSITRAYLARIAAYDQSGPRLNAIIRLNPRALAEAAALDAERKAGKVRGPMHGIPFILKDNYDTGDMPTSAGSLALANSQPARDGFITKQIRDAGGVLIAKSNMHELAAGITSISSLGGQTRNPYDPARCPGGSSGGTGAAIAASFATVGWGSDTCGSIRIPSAFGALVGLRPTVGMASRTGIVPLSHTQDTGGPLARTVTDLAIALDVTVGYDPADPVTVIVQDKRPRFLDALNKDALKGARLGIFAPYFRDTDAEIADSVRAAIATMKALGATVVEVPMPEFDTLMTNTGVTSHETKHDLAAYFATVPNAPVKSLREILALGQFDRELEVRFRSADTFPALETAAHTLTLARQAALRARMERVLDSLQLDAIAYPTMRQAPVFPGQVQAGSTCQLGAQSGLPSIAFPAGFTADGLPVSVELLGKSMSDVKLVSFAYAFEQHGARRRSPTTTPALVAGKAPAPRVVARTLASGTANVAAQITVDVVRNELRWTVTSVGAPSSVSAVVLRRIGGGTLSGVGSSTTGSAPPVMKITVPDDAVRVVARLMGPAMRTASGSLPLSARDRDAFSKGQLSVALYTASGKRVEMALK